MNSRIRIALIIVGVVVLVAVVARIIKTSGSKRRVGLTVERLLKQGARFNTIALQDGNLLVALMHANYAVAYLKMARVLMDRHEVQGPSRERVDEMIFYFEKTQSEIMQQFARQYPSLKVDGMFAISAGWV